MVISLPVPTVGDYFVPNDRADWRKFVGPAEEGFRSDAEIKALRILDQMEADRDYFLLFEISGGRCGKRQRLIYKQGYGAGSGERNTTEEEGS